MTAENVGIYSIHSRTTFQTKQKICYMKEILDPVSTLKIKLEKFITKKKIHTREMIKNLRIKIYLLTHN